ncbi:hypothetical protein [Nocardia altamirensis]|uniref:hypothetical protein n=1 Tax=Nocardia altamirensis TaxID=472158 RepID=UPI00114CE624|nr:hypothetical protein [Nocardia altamirensis]
MSDVQATPQAKNLVPVFEARREELGTLSVEYQQDIHPVLTVRNGHVIPTTLPIIDDAGNTVATYSVDLEPRTERSAPWLALLVFQEGELPDDPTPGEQ